MRTSTIAILSLLASGSAQATEYDPYGGTAHETQKQADAVNPIIIGLKEKALKMYWNCVNQFAAASHIHEAYAQKVAGPSCNDMASGWLNSQIVSYKIHTHQLILREEE